MITTNSPLLTATVIVATVRVNDDGASWSEVIRVFTIRATGEARTASSRVTAPGVEVEALSTGDSGDESRYSVVSRRFRRLQAALNLMSAIR